MSETGILASESIGEWLAAAGYKELARFNNSKISVFAHEETPEVMYAVSGDPKASRVFARVSKEHEESDFLPFIHDHHNSAPGLHVTKMERLYSRAELIEKRKEQFSVWWRLARTLVNFVANQDPMGHHEEKNHDGVYELLRNNEDAVRAANAFAHAIQAECESTTPLIFKRSPKTMMFRLTSVGYKSVFVAPLRTTQEREYAARQANTLRQHLVPVVSG